MHVYVYVYVCVVCTRAVLRTKRGTCMSASLLVHGGAVLETLPYTCDYALSLDVY